MKNISRRSFLKTGAVAAAGLTIVPGSVLGKSFGYTAPSDKLNIAGIGVGGMGRRNLANMNTEYRSFMRCRLALRGQDLQGLSEG